MKATAKRINSLASWISSKSQVASAVLTFIAFTLAMGTIGLIPYAIKSIYIPLTHKCEQRSMYVTDKSSYEAEFIAGKGGKKIEISYLTVTDGEISLRVPTQKWNDCEYGSIVEYYSYGEEVHYYKLKILNGVLIFLSLLVSLSWIMFGLMGVGIKNKETSTPIKKKKSILMIIVEDGFLLVVVGLILVILYKVYLIMNQFIF